MPVAEGRAGRAPRRPFVDDYLVAMLAQASYWISAEFHRVVRASGLPVAEWRILASLAGAPPMPVGRLAQIVLAPQPTVTRQLDRLQRRGLVERVARDGDKRITLVAITEAGQALVSGLVQQARSHERRVMAPLGADRAAQLKAMLRELIDQHRPAA